jgi:hypothetical protein
MNQSELERMSMRLSHTRHRVTSPGSEAGLTVGPAAPSRGLRAKRAHADLGATARGDARCVSFNKITSDS